MHGNKQFWENTEENSIAGKKYLLSKSLMGFEHFS